MLIPKNKESYLCENCDHLRDYCEKECLPDSCDRFHEYQKHLSKQVGWHHIGTIALALILFFLGTVFLKGYTYYSGTEIQTDPDEVSQLEPNTFIAWCFYSFAFLTFLPAYGLKILGRILCTPFVMIWKFIPIGKRKETET